jgi:uncharacterized membrane protein
MTKDIIATIVIIGPCICFSPNCGTVIVIFFFLRFIYILRSEKLSEKLNVIISESLISKYTGPVMGISTTLFVATIMP